MEVWAVLDALETFLRHPETGGNAAAGTDAVPQQITIVSDSTYVVNCFRDSWYRGWFARGWKNSQKQPVANQDLWKPLITLYLDHQSQVTFEWVKGHSGNRMNDLVDALAVAAAVSQYPRRLTDPAGWFQSAEPTDQVSEPVNEQVAEQTSLF